MFRDYSKYGVDDFVRDEDFIQWVQTPLPETDSFWQELIQIFPFQAETIRNARQIVLHLQEASATKAPEGKAEELWLAISHSIESRSSTPTFGQLFRRYRIVAAAAAGVALLICFYYLSLNQQQIPYEAETFTIQVPAHLTESTNLTLEPVQVKLPDSSSVTLYPGSKIRYNAQFDDSLREVYLAGEAFFDVVKNPHQPFIVYANELTTKVLGTSFHIKASKRDESVVVSVKTGRVMVTTRRSPANHDKDPGDIVLTANQQIDYARKEKRLTRSLVEDPLPLQTEGGKPKRKAFANTSLSEILTELEKLYGVEIEFDEQLFSRCHITTNIGDEGLFDVLNALCEAIDASYVEVDTRIVFRGKSCN